MKHYLFYYYSETSIEKVNYKIRNFSNQKVPIIAVIGAREVAENTVTLRKLGSESQEQVSIDDLVSLIAQENAKYLS